MEPPLTSTQPEAEAEGHLQEPGSIKGRPCPNQGPDVRRRRPKPDRAPQILLSLVRRDHVSAILPNLCIRWHSNEFARKFFVEWILKTGVYLNLRMHTQHLTIYLMDRFFVQKNVPLAEMYAYVMAALITATKVENKRKKTPFLLFCFA